VKRSLRILLAVCGVAAFTVVVLGVFLGDVARLSTPAVAAMLVAGVEAIVAALIGPPRAVQHWSSSSVEIVPPRRLLTYVGAVGFVLLLIAVGLTPAWVRESTLWYEATVANPVEIVMVSLFFAGVFYAPSLLMLWCGLWAWTDRNRLVITQDGIWAGRIFGSHRAAWDEIDPLTPATYTERPSSRGSIPLVCIHLAAPRRRWFGLRDQRVLFLRPEYDDSAVAAIRTAKPRRDDLNPFELGARLHAPREDSVRRGQE
jgi:hypothetical protein